MAIRELTKKKFIDAANLLDDDNLIWSADLDSVRKDLAKYLREKAEHGESNSPHLLSVVDRFIAD